MRATIREKSRYEIETDCYCWIVIKDHPDKGSSLAVEIINTKEIVTNCRPRYGLTMAEWQKAPGVISPLRRCVKLIVFRIKTGSTILGKKFVNIQKKCRIGKKCVTFVYRDLRIVAGKSLR